MKKLLPIIVLTWATLAQGQNLNDYSNVSKPVVCAPLDTIFKELADKDINEKPVWVGKREDQKTDFYLFINFKTSAFTMIEAGKEFGCILGIGHRSNFFNPPKQEFIPSSLDLSH